MNLQNCGSNKDSFLWESSMPTALDSMILSFSRQSGDRWTPNPDKLGNPILPNLREGDHLVDQNWSFPEGEGLLLIRCYHQPT